MEGKRDEYGLTRKQRTFCENVVAGMNLSDAYRNAYDAENMKPASIHKRACELMADGKVSGCVEALSVEVKRKSEALVVSDREKLIKLLRSWSDGSESATNSQLRAAELLGKACGLYREVVEDHRERPAQVVAAQLEAKLAALNERLNVQPSVERPPQADIVPVKPVPTEPDGSLSH
jgi:hypothetical protein